MVAKVIAGRIRRHVGEHHVKRRAPQRCEIDLSKIRFLQNHVGGQARRINQLQVHPDDRPPRTDSARSDLTP